jgi:hypothetical protein
VRPEAVFVSPLHPDVQRLVDDGWITARRPARVGADRRVVGSPRRRLAARGGREPRDDGARVGGATVEEVDASLPARGGSSDGIRLVVGDDDVRGAFAASSRRREDGDVDGDEQPARPIAAARLTWSGYEASRITRSRRAPPAAAENLASGRVAVRRPGPL